VTPPLAIGIDLGGTHIKFGVIDQDLNIIDRRTEPTEADRGPDDVIRRLSDTAVDLARNHHIIGIGLGTPGPMSPTQGVVYRCGNLPGWRDVPLRARVGEATQLPVVMDNDANVAAYGEYRHLEDDQQGDLLLLTLGTGVGSGAVIGGKVLHGHFENASEWGHLIVAPMGRPCSCGQRGCLEQYASASAIVRIAREAIESGATSSLKDAVYGGGVLSSVQVADAARQGDATAARVWDDECSHLAVACVAIQHALNPRRILLGGGMADSGALLVDRVRERFDTLSWSHKADTPEIGLARLGNDAGIVGAAAMAWDAFR